jgi:signal transduction histidine kinase
MIEPRPQRLPARPPMVTPPRPFVDRRVAFRRAADRDTHRETVLLARAFDILASEGSAETRLAGLLGLLARTVGARRAAVVADAGERRAAVAMGPDEEPAAAEALANWLDAHAPRSRARRAAAGQAPVSFVVAAPDAQLRVVGSSRSAAETTTAYAALPIPSAAEVTLGFEFSRAVDAGRVEARLPRRLARHAAVALALVTQQLADERELAVLRARDAERATYVSTVAHELRTPLTGLRGYLELILAGRVEDTEVQRDFLERSRAITGSMADLVGDLLELSRLESGSIEFEIEPFSIADAIGQVASNLMPIALERQISLTTALPSRMRVGVGDRRRVEQIVTNLAANALKFTPSGGCVDLEARVDGPAAAVIVRDDGAGIAPEDRDRIFERFHRLADHERITGTGLGLPIARDLARRMGGDLGVASVRGSGSSFVLVVPGPAAVEAGAIEAFLAETIDHEERSLEEREVRRAIAAATASHGGDANGRTPQRRANRSPRLASSRA